MAYRAKGDVVPYIKPVSLHSPEFLLGIMHVKNMPEMIIGHVIPLKDKFIGASCFWT